MIAICHLRSNIKLFSSPKCTCSVCLAYFPEWCNAALAIRQCTLPSPRRCVLLDSIGNAITLSSSITVMSRQPIPDSGDVLVYFGAMSRVFMMVSISTAIRAGEPHRIQVSCDSVQLQSDSRWHRIVIINNICYVLRQAFSGRTRSSLNDPIHHKPR